MAFVLGALAAPARGLGHTPKFEGAIKAEAPRKTTWDESPGLFVSGPKR